MPTIIFKATEACNSNCVYCDVVHRKKPKTITTELLEVVYQKINQYLEEFQDEEMQIIWHGGEPCMAGLELYKAALRFQSTYCANTSERIKYAVQSNLTMLSQDFIDVFNKMGIYNIGTSYEPIPGVRGIGKKRDSHLYNKLFFDGINLLEKNGMTYGFIYVVTKRVLDKPLEVFYHLSNLKPHGEFDLHPVLVYDDAAQESLDSAITQEEFADFLGAIFKVWWEHRDRYPEVEPFRSYLRHYQGDLSGLGCNDSPTCGLHLYIGPEGETSQCGRAADWGLLNYGNINDKSLKEIFADAQRAEIDRRKDILREKDCHNCEYWPICHGGCPLDAYNEKKTFATKTDQCKGKKLFLKKYFEPITGLKFPKYEE